MRDHSDPRVIFEATAWAVLTVLVTYLSVSFYWDFRASFQEYTDGQWTVGPNKCISSS